MKEKVGGSRNFYGNFQVNVKRVFAFFFCPNPHPHLLESCSFWYGLKDLFTLHKLHVADKVVLDH